MKKTVKICFVVVAIVFAQQSEAQIWKKIKKRAEKKVEQKILKETDKKVDKVLNPKEAEKKRKQDSITASKPDEKKIPSNQENGIKDSKKGVEIWRNYKFVPGEKVIFYDDQKIEEVGEFPSRWDLISGVAEIVRFDDEKVIIGLAEYNNRITPLFDSTNYLSDEFTIEFDVYLDNVSRKDYNNWVNYNIYFDESRYKQRGGTPDIKLGFRSGKTEGYAADYNFTLEEVPLGELYAWHHIALSYYKGKFKLYFDEKRIANLPKFDIAPSVFAIDFDGHASGRNDPLKVAIKNVKIAHGGGQLYKRIVADGAYVTNGILFDTGKAVLKTESMGVINKMIDLMKDNKDWSFEIIGHTDSDGDTATNLQLSQDRAEAVKQVMVKNGIDVGRLSTLGKGESEPLNQNRNVEEKANNRRVEFILKK